MVTEMTITYEVGAGLYVNVTNRCTNSCDFCVRSVVDGTYGELWLEREPTREEIFNSILSRELGRYSEVVFCGYGEPTERIDDVLWVAEELKKVSDIPVRINTNGHANLIAGRDVTPELAGRIDCVSVSLNTSNAEDYVKICHPVFGEKAFDGLLDFAEKAGKYVPEVLLSVVKGSIPDSELEECKKLAADRNIKLKIREYIT